MKWGIIRKHYPNRIVLIEAIKTYSFQNKRYVEDMTVVSCHEDTKEAWAHYKKHRQDFPTREFYIFHTSKEEIVVIEETLVGVRGAV